MSEESNSKQFNIHIMSDSTNKERVEKSNNQSETYILVMNEQLNNRVKELEDDLNIVKQENDSLTDENERIEKSLIYQRGLLHNFDDINNKQSDMIQLLEKYVSKYKENNKKINSNYQSMINFCYQLIYAFSTVLILSLAINIINFTDCLFMIFQFLLVYYLSIYVFNIDRKEFNLQKILELQSNNLKEIDSNYSNFKTEIDSLTKNNNHIGEFIDNI